MGLVNEEDVGCKNVIDSKKLIITAKRHAVILIFFTEAEKTLLWRVAHKWLNFNDLAACTKIF